MFNDATLANIFQSFWPLAIVAVLLAYLGSRVYSYLVRPVGPVPAIILGLVLAFCAAAVFPANHVIERVPPRHGVPIIQRDASGEIKSSAQADAQKKEERAARFKELTDRNVQ